MKIREKYVPITVRHSPHLYIFIVRSNEFDPKQLCMFELFYLTFGSCAVVVPMLQSIFSMSEDILPLIMSFCCIFVSIALRKRLTVGRQRFSYCICFTSMFRAAFMDTTLVELLL